MDRGRRVLARIGLVGVGLVLALVAAELALRLRFEVDAYYPWRPHLARVFRPSPEILPGVEGVSRFVINSLGVRGDEPPSGEAYRILAVGGSTTECLYLDQEETWPQLVQRWLDERRSPAAERVWVGNAGMSGRGSRDHVVLLKHYLPQLDDLDLVLLMVGANDFLLRLGQDDGFDPEFLARPDAERLLLPRTFERMPRARETRFSALEGSALWTFLGRVRSRLVPPPGAQDDQSRVYETWRGRRRAASGLRPELPAMGPALDEFRRNVGTLIDLCRARSIRVLLLTQPSIWSADLDEDVARYLWLGGVGPFMRQDGAEYYTHAALARGMALYNQVLIDLARERDVECLDLAGQLPRDLGTFYDDVHFNESGARRVAERIAEHLLARPPFAFEDG